MAILDHRLNTKITRSTIWLPPASPFRRNLAPPLFAGGHYWCQRWRDCRAKAKYAMGLYGDGICHDRRRYPQFCGSAATGDGLCDNLAMAAGGGWNGGALKFMILPMVALSLAYIASIARITRGSMIEVLHSNFIRTARAKDYRCVESSSAMR